MDAYSPADLAAALAAGLPTVLGWVGVGVSAGALLMVAFVGIRAAFRFFSGLAFDRAQSRAIADFYAPRDAIAARLTAEGHYAADAAAFAEAEFEASLPDDWD